MDVQPTVATVRKDGSGLYVTNSGDALRPVQGTSFHAGAKAHVYRLPGSGLAVLRELPKGEYECWTVREVAGVADGRTDDLPKFVVDEETGDKGEALKGVYRCRLDGCRGVRIPVRWSDGKHTFPCSKGMVEVPGQEDTWMIPSRHKAATGQAQE